MLKTLALFLLAMLALAFPAFAQDDDDKIRQWAVSAEASSEYGSTAWSASQATGAPNALTCSDNSSAWASATTTEVATLTVYYGVAVYPTEINIYQNFNPGFVKAVSLVTVEGDVLELDGVGALPEECPGVHVIELEDVEDAINGLIIEVDQRELNNWSEIDAVELVGVPATEGLVLQWAIAAEASSQYGEDSWSAAQATGEPDVAACGDNTAAWASASSTEEATLIVYFETPVIPTQINIYQTYNPGAIVSLEMLSIDGESYEFEITEEEATTECPGILSIDFEPSDVLIDAVAIHLDQSITGSWNEIDAVELVGTLLEETAELSGELELDGFSINYPSDWAATIDEGGVPVLANSEEALENGFESNEDDVFITVDLPSVLEDDYGVDLSDDIDEILESVLEVAGIDSVVEDYDALDNPAVIAQFSFETITRDVALIVVEYDDGVVMYAVEMVGDFEDIESQIIEILNTAAYEG